MLQECYVHTVAIAIARLQHVLHIMVPVVSVHGLLCGHGLAVLSGIFLGSQTDLPLLSVHMNAAWCCVCKYDATRRHNIHQTVTVL